MVRLFDSVRRKLVPAVGTNGVAPRAPHASAPGPPDSPERVLREAFWIVLGREISAIELRDQLRTFTPADTRAFVARLLASPEFRIVHDGYKQDHPTRDAAVLDAGLRTIGSDNWFTDRAYEFVLGRPADAGGRESFLSALAGGATREHMVRSLLMSDEFERHYTEVSPEGGFIPRDTQLCELANPAKWDNPEWMAILRELAVAPDHKLAMHRKSYEFTQLVYGLSRLGRLRGDVAVLSVGAGHEGILYYLANRVGSVVATDLYEGQWQAAEGDERVVHDPGAFAPFPYRQDHLVFLKMNALQLAFRPAAFDVAYSLSSIEHFGGLEGATAALDEMARVLKPGGILALATEYLISGPPQDEVFQPHEVNALVSRPGLRLVQPIDEWVYRRYEYVPINLHGNPHQTPHMVVRWNDTVFTTVMVFLEKL